MTRARCSVLVLAVTLLGALPSCTKAQGTTAGNAGAAGVQALCAALALTDPLEIAICQSAPDVATLINELATHRAGALAASASPHPAASR
jgi:hypothetical protein